MRSTRGRKRDRPLLLVLGVARRRFRPRPCGFRSRQYSVARTPSVLSRATVHVPQVGAATCSRRVLSPNRLLLRSPLNHLLALRRPSAVDGSVETATRWRTTAILAWQEKFGNWHTQTSRLRCNRRAKQVFEKQQLQNVK